MFLYRGLKIMRLFISFTIIINVLVGKILAAQINCGDDFENVTEQTSFNFNFLLPQDAQTYQECNWKITIGSEMELEYKFEAFSLAAPWHSVLFLLKNDQVYRQGSWKKLDKAHGQMSTEINETLDFSLHLVLNHFNKNFHRVKLNIEINPLNSVDPQDCQCGEKEESLRIVGGIETSVHEFPWHVGLAVPFGEKMRPFCGGTLIGPDCVLTAAHCLDTSWASFTKVLIGEHDWTKIQDTNHTQIFTLSNFKIHPGYSSKTLDNDIAVLKLARKVSFDGKTKQAACLGSTSGSFINRVVTNLSTDEAVTAIGWGVTSYDGNQSKFLQKVQLNMTDMEQCQENYGQAGVALTDNMICAAGEGRDTCQGDSGGPLLKVEGGKTNVIGVVSFGIGCAHPYFPGIFTKVANYVDWIGAQCATCS